MGRFGIRGFIGSIAVCGYYTTAFFWQQSLFLGNGPFFQQNSFMLKTILDIHKHSVSPLVFWVLFSLYPKFFGFLFTFLLHFPPFGDMLAPTDTLLKSFMPDPGPAGPLFIYVEENDHV
jgi:hypothetical protein